jgi:hypothetical protein
VHATVASAPTPSITLQWNASTLAGNYIVRRRDGGATAWMQIAMLPGNATEYVDRSQSAVRTSTSCIAPRRWAR